MNRGQEKLVGLLLLLVVIVSVGVGFVFWSLPGLLPGTVVAVIILPSAYRLLRYPSLRKVSAGDVAKHVRRGPLSPIGGGLLVAFSGIDGSGKTTQADHLVDALEDRGVTTVRVWARWRPILSYPFMGVLYLTYGWRRKDYNQSSILKRIWAYLVLVDQIVFAAWYIWPHLLRGKVVCVDRYLVDQIVELKFDGLYNPRAAELFRAVLPMPEETFVLDVPVTVAIERKEDTGEMLDRLGIETSVESYLNRRRTLLLETAKELDATVVDTTHPVSETHDEICDQVLGIYFSP